MAQSYETMPPPDATVRDLWACQGICKQKRAFRLDRKFYARNKQSLSIVRCELAVPRSRRSRFMVQSWGQLGESG